MNPKPINRKIIGLLKGLTDDKYVSLRQRKHIEVTGIYGGIELLSVLTRPDSGVAHFAHLGGLFIGFILIRYWKIKRPAL